LDLFGDPVPQSRDRAGRPPHVRTQENSNKINLLFATGHDLKDAARAIGITLPTLRKHYFPEVEKWQVAQLRLKAKLLVKLDAEAEGGSVPAAKELFKQIERGALVKLADKVANRGKAEPKLGKKELQRQAAGQVGGKFAPPAPPPLLVN
jgi:hypothetical protein